MRSSVPHCSLLIVVLAGRVVCSRALPCMCQHEGGVKAAERCLCWLAIHEGCEKVLMPACSRHTKAAERCSCWLATS